MKSILILSDLHLKPICKYGLRSLKFDLLRMVLQTFRAQVNFIVITGDLEDSSLVDLDLEMEIAQVFLDLKEDLRKLVILGGNHETRLQKYVPSDLFAVGAGIRVVKEDHLILDNGNLVFRGFSKEPIPDGLGRFFFGHQPVNYKNQSWFETQAEDLLKLSYERIFLGDIHQRHDIQDKLHSVGAMFTSSFSDEGLIGNFVVLEYDEHGSSVSRYETDPSGTYPKFHTVNVEDFKMSFAPWDIEHNIFKLKFRGPVEENTQERREKLRDELLAKGARQVLIGEVSYTNGVHTLLPSEILSEREAIKQRAKEAAWAPEMEMEFERRLS